MQTIDTNLFLWFNGFHSAFFDNFMYFVSNKWTWLPLYVCILFVIVLRWRKQSLWVLLAVVLAVVLADQISSGIIKNLVQRLRPSHEPSLAGLVHTVKNYTGGLYGFVSSHAANSFALATLISLLFKNRIYTFAIFLWAIINSYSRIYLGVHYPFDILGGMIVGVVVALLCYFLLIRFCPQTQKKSSQ